MVFNLFVLVFFFVLLFSHNHRMIGRVSFVSYAIYILFITGLDGFAGFNGVGDDYFYHLTALMNACIAYIVYGRYRVFAILSFVSIFACVFGLIMYEAYNSPTAYNTIAVIITILQVLLLVARVITDAISIKGTRGRALVRIINFDSFQPNHELSLFEEETSK